jgi:hypothetical protein
MRLVVVVELLYYTKSYSIYIIPSISKHPIEPLYAGVSKALIELLKF